MSRPAMGRGLNALFNLQKPDQGGVRELAIDLLRANPKQPRTDFDDAALEGLAESIRAQGVIQPLVVRPLGETYQVVTGERRLRAAKRAGLAKLPVVIRHDLDETKVLFLALIENLQRQDLNPVEEALSLETLLRESGSTHEELAKSIGKSRVHVTNTLRLLKLPSEVLEFLRQGRLSAGHARALLSLDLAEQMVMLAERVLEEGWSVRKLEAYIKEYGRRRDAEAKEPPPKRDTKLFRRARNDLEDFFGSKVDVRQTEGRPGKITIQFETKKDLKRILQRISDVEIEDEA